MAVSGRLQDIPLTTLISINCTEGNQSHLTLRQADREAHLFFEAGQIVHIETEGRQGEEVIYELLRWKDGEFELELGVPPPARTVNSSWSNLVLEGMRLIDEAGVQSAWSVEGLVEQDQVTHSEEEMATQWATIVGQKQVSVEKQTILPKESKPMAKRRSEILTEQLEALLRDSSDINGAVVVGTDGLVLSSNLPIGGHDATRVGAEGAALVGLSKRALNNLKCGEFQVGILQGKDGWIIVTAAGTQAIVLGLTDAGVNLGMALLEMRDVARDVAQTMG